ncbi:IS110 family transposase [Brevundimonas sp. P7753]|nr:IS110 family transposase [Brevundimonas sp. P7753]
MIRTDARSTEVGRRLRQIPGVGPLRASAPVGTIVEPKVVKTGRNPAAWIGLVPKQNFSGGKERPGGITRQGVATCARCRLWTPWPSFATPYGMDRVGRGWRRCSLDERRRSQPWVRLLSVRTEVAPGQCGEMAPAAA